MDEYDRKRYVPPNILQTNRIFGFKKRNLIEGLVWAVLAGLLISTVPFVKKVEIIVIVCIGIALILLNAFGIKGYALSSTFLNFLSYRKYMKTFSYRRLSKNVPVTPDVIDKKGNIRTLEENRLQKNIKTIFGKQ